MHSSRMRTGRSLTVCRSLLPGGEGRVCFGGVSSARGVCSGGFLLQGVCSRGVSAAGGSAAGGCLFLGGVSAPRGWSLPLGGVCSRGVCSQGGLLPGGVCSWGVSAPGDVCSQGVGVCSPGGVCSRGCLLPGGSGPHRGCLLWGEFCSGGWYPSMH